MTGLHGYAPVEDVRAVARARATEHRAVRVLIVGSGVRAVRLSNSLARRGMAIVGAIDDEPQPALETASPVVPWLGGLNRMVTEAIERHVDELHVAIPLRSGFDAWVRARHAARQVGIPVVFEFDFIEDFQNTRIVTSELTGTVFHYNRHPSRRLWARLGKRLVDLVGASVALLALAPLLLLAAVAIKCTSPGPIFFRQARVGLARRSFQMIKFRTMVTDAERQPTPRGCMDPDGILSKVAYDPRVTPVGAWLRKTSIDELPQLFNVLRGEMSLVGPRPLPTWVYEQVRDLDFHRRFAVLPGMTGRWQVESREQNFARMTEHDLAYVDAWSFSGDLSILIRTPRAVFRGAGAN